MKNAILLVAIVLVAMLLSGCASFQSATKGNFENRLSCSLDGKQAYFLSEWFKWLSLGARIAESDAAVACAPKVIILRPTTDGMKTFAPGDL